MTLGEFADGLQDHGCELINAGLFPGTTYRAVIARRETDRVRVFSFIDEGRNVILPQRFLREAFERLFQ